MSFQFRRHPEYAGKHFVLSPSSHVLDQDRTYEELDKRIRSNWSAEIGTIIHSLAADLIKYKLSTTKTKAYDQISLELLRGGVPRTIINPYEFVDTFVLYVNDAISFDMSPEVTLVYSEKAGGTTDAISWNEKKRYLRIHDLKTGTNAVKMDQLAEYAAYFCLEYKIAPKDILQTELRIYQNGDFVTYNPSTEELVLMQDRIITGSEYLINNY